MKKLGLWALNTTFSFNQHRHWVLHLFIEQNWALSQLKFLSFKAEVAAEINKKTEKEESTKKQNAKKECPSAKDIDMDKTAEKVGYSRL